MNFTDTLIAQVANLINNDEVKHDDKNHIIVAVARYISTLNGQTTGELISALYKQAAMDNVLIGSARQK